jgi:hypothetical protein
VCHPCVLSIFTKPGHAKHCQMPFLPAVCEGPAGYQAQQACTQGHWHHHTLPQTGMIQLHLPGPGQRTGCVLGPWRPAASAGMCLVKGKVQAHRWSHGTLVPAVGSAVHGEPGQVIPCLVVQTLLTVSHPAWWLIPGLLRSRRSVQLSRPTGAVRMGSRCVPCSACNGMRACGLLTA